MKPIRIIVGYPAGGTTDVLSRQMGAVLGEKFKQNVVVENKPGGSTVIAAQSLAAARADGYTMAVFDPSTVTMNQFLFKKPPYDPAKAFRPVTVLSSIPIGIVARADFPANTLQEFVAYVKKNPGVPFGSTGAGNPNHLAMELFRNAAGGLSMVHVPYKGGAPAIVDLLGGQVPFVIIDIPNAMEHIRSGKLKAIAITSPKRSSLLPDVPTIAESGYPGFQTTSWYGVFVPAQTPDAIVEKLNASLREVMASPQLEKWTKAQTLEIETSTQQEIAERVRLDSDKYAKLIKQLDLHLD